ncbi:MAG: hypothetical protein HKN09_11440, partial [Saprospiraceae bacterium]|nr:hypothetical protein [Saprospiraceae bacterium]
MTNLRFITLLNSLSFLIMLQVVDAQMDPCVDYPPIDGPTCYVCAPAGWDNFDTPAEVFDLDNLCCSSLCTYNIQDLSPTGGTFMHIQTATSPEMMGTTLTGLAAGAEYLITFYWMSLYCDPLSTTGPDLIITLDGEEYYYEAVYDWELIEICFTPSATEVDLILNPETIPSGGALVVDTGDCLEATLECCALQLDIEETWSVCPDQVLSIFGEAQNAVGNVSVTWDCNPSSGLNYLSDVSILNPEFNYFLGQEQFQGTSFTYSITIEDDLCEVEKFIVVEVLPTTEPQFELPDVCADDGSYAFPLISDNGISGTWLIEDIEPEDLSGMTVMNTFFPEEDLFLCPIQVQDQLFIDPIQYSMFELPEYLCHSDGPTYLLPEEDINNIEGTWNIEEIIMEEYYNASVNLIFTPYDTYCTEGYETTIAVWVDSLSFILPDTVCQDAGLILLDSISNEGYLGSWNINPIDPSEYQDSLISLKWYAANGQNACIDSFEYQLHVTGSVDPIFSLPALLCIEDPSILLPLTSKNSISGTWDLAEIDPGDLGEGIHSALFVSDSTNCSIEYRHEFEIVEASVPEFMLLDTLCALDNLYTLNNISDNGISGQWNIDAFELQDFEGQTVALEFQPDIDCAEPMFHSIFVQTAQVAEFSLPEYLCWNDPELFLPNESENNIQGAWNVNSLNPEEDAGMQIALTFTPDQRHCAGDVNFLIDLVDFASLSLNTINPTDCGTADGQIVIENVDLDFEFSIDGGMNWQTLNLFQDLSPGLYEIYSRSVLFPDCISISNVLLESPDAPEIENINISPVTSCLVNNGRIKVLASGVNLEYSIDNGQSWQFDDEFSG